MGSEMVLPACYIRLHKSIRPIFNGFKGIINQMQSTTKTAAAQIWQAPKIVTIQQLATFVEVVWSARVKGKRQRVRQWAVEAGRKLVFARGHAAG